MDVGTIEIIQKIACVCIGYICGLFSTALLIGRARGKDIRKHGSGNLGSTNALRTLGWGAGVLSFIGDIGKAVFAFLILHFLIFQELDLSMVVLYAGLGLTLGHNFPVHLKFRGGKGIAVLLTIVIAFDWRIAIIPFVVFVFLVFITKFVSLGSLLASAIMFMQILILPLFDVDMGPHYAETTIILGILVCLAWFMHRENLKRLVKGEEKPFKNKKK